jgi:hypothetical protein
MASLEVGWEYQPKNQQPNIQSFQLGYQASLWEIRGALAWPDNSISAGVIREFETDTALAPYLGAGLWDLNDAVAPWLSSGEKVELIAGLKLNLNAVLVGLSLGLEARITPDNLYGYIDSLYPEYGVSINYRFPSSEASPESGPPISKTSPADRKLLAQLITVEAPEEPYNGQVAVAAVVLNRLKSGRFPETVRDVIYEPGQFSYQRKLAAIKPTDAAYRAANEAIQGNDPSHGAQYFYNPDHASPAGWRFFHSGNLQVTARIGSHVFMKLKSGFQD